MIKISLVWLLLSIVLLGSSPAHAAEPEGLIDISRSAPEIQLDMRYATPENFLRRAVYPLAVCLLRPAVAERLVRVQRRVAVQGYTLRLWDCYRPLSVQKQMWAIVHDERYVADPAKGSRHNRGAAVDLTLSDAQGVALEMPTSFDDFSARAGRDAEAGWSETARRNYAVLDRAMRSEGFLPLPSEWWHYDATGWEIYPVLDVPLAPR
ncbi:MAG: M15 family metallopeptidase [Gemmatimonadaceae bacterium]|nr:M15 family metallopeptidase [Gloeobacterales cyanobacterium ES-bin-141]